MRSLLLILSSLVVAPAWAQEQSHKDAARDLLELMNVDQAIEQSYDQIYSQLEGMATQLQVTEAQQPIFDRYLEKMSRMLRVEMSWKRMEPHIIDAYVSVYTEAELRELAEFYASPLGQKFVAKMPELTQATMRMTQDMLENFVPRVQEIQAELEAELAASRAE